MTLPDKTNNINNINIYLPPPVARALEILDGAGFEAYIVGGCVRDALRGVEPHDYDITTAATPEEVEAAFDGFRVIETGIQHGTVTVVIDGEPLEITTFRTDGTYSDGRHPDSVSFTRSIEEDLARRDFTVNAIAYSPAAGFADPFGGRADIERGVLRAVGVPSARFTEDSLRVMRGLRFAATLGYRLEDNTVAAMRECMGLMERVSGERIYIEMKKLLCGDRAGDIVREYYDILACVVPALEAMHGCEQIHPYHVYDVLEHTIRVLEGVPPEPDMRLAALLHDTGKPDCRTFDEQGLTHFHGHAAASLVHAERFFDRMKPDLATRGSVTKMIAHHDDRFEPSRPALTRLLRVFGEHILRGLLTLRRADVLAQNPAEPYILRAGELERCAAILDDIIASGDCYEISMLAVRGGDLIAAGLRPGKALGDTLEYLLGEVIDGRLPNEKQALITAALEHSRR